MLARSGSHTEPANPVHDTCDHLCVAPTETQYDILHPSHAKITTWLGDTRRNWKDGTSQKNDISRSPMLLICSFALTTVYKNLHTSIPECTTVSKCSIVCGAQLLPQKHQCCWHKTWHQCADHRNLVSGYHSRAEPGCSTGLLLPHTAD